MILKWQESAGLFPGKTKQFVKFSLKLPCYLTESGTILFCQKLLRYKTQQQASILRKPFLYHFQNSILSRLVSTNWWLDEVRKVHSSRTIYNIHINYPKMMPFIPEKMQYWSENHQIGWMTGNQEKRQSSIISLEFFPQRIIQRILIFDYLSNNQYFTLNRTILDWSSYEQEPRFR